MTPFTDILNYNTKLISLVNTFVWSEHTERLSHVPGASTSFLNLQYYHKNPCTVYRSTDCRLAGFNLCPPVLTLRECIFRIWGSCLLPLNSTFGSTELLRRAALHDNLFWVVTLSIRPKLFMFESCREPNQQRRWDIFTAVQLTQRLRDSCVSVCLLYVLLTACVCLIYCALKPLLASLFC